MGIIRIIKEICSFFIDDLKSDFRTLSSILNGEYKCRYSKEELKQMLDVKAILKTYWPFVLLLIATGCVSWFLAAKYYQLLCNDLIIKAQQACTLTGDSAYTIPINFTLS